MFNILLLRAAGAVMFMALAVAAEEATGLLLQEKCPVAEQALKPH
jgi:hypothetical protein